MADDDPDKMDFGDAGDPFTEASDESSWDADDPRRQRDQFAPPTEPCECYCLHCNRTFMSGGMWFQRVIGDKRGFEGFWMCPTPNCDGKGFTFDIFPTDPHHPANAGWCDDEDDDCEAFEEQAMLEELDAENVDAGEWDPEEPFYQSMDDQDDDIEGEEWKYGLEPGERLFDPGRWDSRNRWEEEQQRYDAPDERPRELDWSHLEDRDGPIDGFNEDDIPF